MTIKRKNRSKSTRRAFIAQSAGLLAASFVAPTLVSAKALGRDGNVAPSERVVMGMVGVGKQGRLDIQGFLCFGEAQIVAVCDCYENHAGMAAKMVNDAYGNLDCQSYWDFNEVIHRDDIDAIFVGTTSHWHPYISIEAMKNGKDVYCEKPETFSVRDGRLIQQAVEKYNRVYSGGSQRVWNDYNAFHKIIRKGLIGDVVEGHVNTTTLWIPYEVGNGEPIPHGLHWDRFLGPAREVPFISDLIGTGGGAFQVFTSGDLLGWGTHAFGGAMFAMGLDQTGPTRIIPPDGKDVTNLTFEFADGQKIIEGSAWGNVLGIRKGLPGFRGGLISFRGTEGSLCERDIVDEIVAVHGFFAKRT